MTRKQQRECVGALRAATELIHTALIDIDVTVGRIHDGDDPSDIAWDANEADAGLRQALVELSRVVAVTSPARPVTDAYEAIEVAVGA